MELILGWVFCGDKEVLSDKLPDSKLLIRMYDDFIKIGICMYDNNNNLKPFYDIFEELSLIYDKLDELPLHNIVYKMNDNLDGVCKIGIDGVDAKELNRIRKYLDKIYK